MFLRSLPVVAALLCAPSVAQAEAQSYQIDAVHSQIIYFVDHLGFSKSAGKFPKFSGTVNFDESDLAQSSLELTIDIASLDTHDADWNKHLLGGDFFNAQAHPTATFKSTAIAMSGSNQGTLTGELTLLGVTKPVTIPFTFNKAGKHPYSGKMVVGFSGTATLKRSEFGMTKYAGVVGEEVELRLELEAARDADKPAVEKD